MKKLVVSLIIENTEGKLLLLLRDNKPTIPFPNHWHTPGGKAEAGETPEQAIAREMKEEIELELKEFSLFKKYEWPEKTEYVYYIKAGLDPSTTPIHEGQKLQYFAASEIEKMNLAFHNNEILHDFFASKQ